MAPLAYFQPRERYLDSLSALQRRGSGDQFRQGLRQIVTQATQAPDIARRNRLWFDAVHLWRGDWRRDLKPESMGLADIAAARDALAHADDAPSELQSLTATVLSEAWPDFESFQASAAGAYTVDFERTDGDWLGQYHAWLDRYLPCLLMGLADEPDLAQRQVAPRIEWMIAKLALDANDADDYRDALLDKCWRYVRAHRRLAPSPSDVF